MASISFYEPQDIYFADEGEHLTVGSSDQTTALDVAVEVDGSQVASFDLDTFNGLAVIPIGEILRNIEGRNQDIPCAMAVTVSQGEDAARLDAICLFCRRYGDGVKSAVFANWLTTGPAERNTFYEAAETLPFLADSQATDQKAMIQLVFEDGNIQVRTYADLKTRSGEGLDVSPSAVRAFARSQVLYAQIQSYSLWIEYRDSAGNATTGESVRFVIIRDRLSRITYKFIGARGAYEYIHASGELKRTIENETSTFITSGIETELNNSAVKSMEQNSGHIGSAAEAEFWFAFLSSQERYVLEADGTERLIIIEDSKPSLTDLKVGELSFSWHYSNKNNTVIKRASIPLESISITGDSVIENDSNQLQLGIIYSPAATTQRGVTWELLDGSRYASLSSSGLLTIREGADGASVTVKAASAANGEIFATKTFNVTYREAAAPMYGLTIATNVDSPGITLSINGQTTEYFDGILISEGAAVIITVSKAGYATQTRPFTFSYNEKDQYFELVESVEATVTPIFAEISQPAQNVQYTISDPSNHGWTLDFDGPDSYGTITGGGIVSGNATKRGAVISGTGDAVVYLTVAANSNRATRTIGQAPFYFSDDYTNTRKNLTINQLGTEDTQTLVTSISLNKSSLSLAAGSSEQLTATVSPSNATNKNVAWSSSETSVATVDQDGTVRAVGAGTATITASSTDGSNKNAYCTVTVTASTVAVTGVSLNKSSIIVAVGGTSQLLATVAPPNATNKTVTWRSTATSVARVDSTGLITGVARGACRIYVKTSDGNYEAYCSVNVTDNGSIEAEDITAKSQATSAASRLTLTNIQTATLAASCSAAWVTAVTIDSSGSPVRVRLTIRANSEPTARSATVVVTGTDTAGNSVSSSFVITQNGNTSSDISCTAMAMSGPDEIYNSDNLADYSITFTPSNSTQSKVVWSVTDRSGNATNYAEIAESSDDRCSVRVLPGANGALLRVKAVNYYNGSLVVTKDITATYVAPASGGHIEVNESYIEVAASSTEDDWAQVTLVNMLTSLTNLGVAVSGFIAAAQVLSSGKVKVDFPANTSSESRSGSVTLTGTNTDGQNVQAIITYLQQGKQSNNYGLDIQALQIVGTTKARFAIVYFNESYADKTLTLISYTLTGYNSGGTVTCRKTGSLTDKTVAAYASEEEDYEVDIEVTGPTIRYKLMVTADNNISDTYEGDGTDEI